MLSELPIDAALPAVQAGLRCGNCVVLRAPAGAGKTTRVPPALLISGCCGSGTIIMLEPRRIAARAAARRIAGELGEKVGLTAGYRVRFEDCAGPTTRILVVTEGILLRRLLEDPFLEGVAAVIFDEFHERRLDSDLALAMTRRVQQTVRPELRIVVMSATLDPGPVAAYLGNCPVVESSGRLHPVEIQYMRQTEQQPVTSRIMQGVTRALDRTPGDILVFLPGVGEILRTQRELEPLGRRHSLAVMPLFGDMPAEDQDRVLSRGGQRKIVLATNVAETSVTIEGITAVVDTGTARQMQFDADVGLDRLELVNVSQASADQRAGRAGRTGPGYCMRLWDQNTHRHRAEFETAELHRVDLSGAVLRLCAWGESRVAEFPWFEPPPAAAIEHALRLLERLGAVAGGNVTELGQQLVQFPVSPRIARLLVEGQRLGHGDRSALLAALLTERDPFTGGKGASRDLGSPGASRLAPRTVAQHRSRSDVLDRLAAFEDFLRTRQTQSDVGTIHPGAARMVEQAYRQLQRILAGSGIRRLSVSDDSDETLLRALVTAFPDRVARRRDPGGDKGVLPGGRGVRLGPRSAVREAPLFLCVDIDGRGTDALVRQASEVRRDWLPESLLRTADDLFFHPSQKQVVARRRTWFDDLCLDETPVAVTDPVAAGEILFQAARAQFDSVFPGADDSLTCFLTRLRCLREWMPELQLPAFDRSLLENILQELCHGRRSFAELKQAPWLSTLQARLPQGTLDAVQREAPERLTVPSGSRISLIYEPGRPPVLPVRIQEIFGWRQTPRVGGGRISVLLHLLAPNMRPQQVTDDLASFWANTYAEVRRELKRRYPRHAWPEDPLTAQPVRKG